MSGKEEYRNWVPKKKGFLPIPPKSDFLCSPMEVSAHRKVKLKSKPILEDTAQRFEELCEHFPEVFSKNNEDIGRTNLIAMDIDTGNHPPICQKPYMLALKHYEWEFDMVPFGLAQAPAYFQALISEVLKGLSHFMIAYLDNIIIFSKLKRNTYSTWRLFFRDSVKQG